MGLGETGHPQAAQLCSMSWSSIKTGSQNGIGGRRATPGRTIMFNELEFNEKLEFRMGFGEGATPGGTIMFNELEFSCSLSNTHVYRLCSVRTCFIQRTLHEATSSFCRPVFIQMFSATAQSLHKNFAHDIS